MNRFSDKSLPARDGSIDCLRAVGIILMVMGHIGFGGSFDKWIHGFHMPMFFLISGYFFRPVDVRRLLVRRGRTLLLPYFAFGLIHCFLYFAFVKHQFRPRAFYLLLWENTAHSGIPIAGALWFLTALFFADLIYAALDRAFSGWLLTGAAALTAVLGMAAASYLPVRLPWALDAALVGVGLFHAGRLLKMHGGNVSGRLPVGGRSFDRQGPLQGHFGQVRGKSLLPLSRFLYIDMVK